MNPASFLHGVRYAYRQLARSPGFTAIALLTFAVGIGVNSAVFSIFNAVLLRPLPYPDADRITMMWLDNRRRGIHEDIGSYPNYLAWREQSTSFEHVAAFVPANFTLTGAGAGAGAGEPERIAGAQTTANYFAVAGLQPVLGRVFDESHETPGNDRVVILSHGLWQRKFGGAANVLGKTMTLDGNPHEVIGVMPPEMQLPQSAQLWRPLAPSERLRNARGAFWLPVIGKLKPGVSLERAQTEMDGIAARVEQDYPEMRGFGSYLNPLHRQMVGNIERSLLVLVAAVGCVLLIACANLSNLMLGRTAARRKEFAIRTALGARRARLIRQIVTETVVLALCGSVLGLLLAFGATKAFIALGGAAIPRVDNIAIDTTVLLFTLAIAIVSALIAALLPAIHVSRGAIRNHLQEGGREGGGGSSQQTRSVLIVAETALAFILLAGAGILVRTLWSMEDISRGFNPERIAVATVSLPPTLYAELHDVRDFYARLLDRVRGLPGVESAATGTAILLPLLANATSYSIEGKPRPPPEERVEYPFEIVSPGYFETLGIQLTAGRAFDSRDHADAARTVIINETLARSGWPGEDPLGRRMRSGGEDSQAPWMTVVGVIKDVHRGEVTHAIRPELYMAAPQATPRTQTIFVRTTGDPGAILPSLRREVQAIDPQLPLIAAGTLEAEMSETLSQPRFRAVLLAAFAGIAMLLASIGIYGVTSHAVGQRTQEVGVRMALGAQRRDVLVLILRQHLTSALIGVALGLAGALAMARFLETMVYGVATRDPLTLTAMSLLLFLVAVAACFVPARRATKVDAVVALRNM